MLHGFLSRCTETELPIRSNSWCIAYYSYSLTAARGMVLRYTSVCDVPGQKLCPLQSIPLESSYFLLLVSAPTPSLLPGLLLSRCPKGWQPERFQRRLDSMPRVMRIQPGSHSQLILMVQSPCENRCVSFNPKITSSLGFWLA